MSGIKGIAGALEGRGARVGVVASRFNEQVVDGLVEGALDCLVGHGVERSDIELVRVPGAWEIPLALERLAASGRFAALVALGAVIRGETAHFDYISAECSRGIATVALRYGLPVGFGVLTCYSREQAAVRAARTPGNKGREAAEAALEMASLLRELAPAS